MNLQKLLHFVNNFERVLVFLVSQYVGQVFEHLISIVRIRQSLKINLTYTVPRPVSRQFEFVFIFSLEN